MKSFTHKIKRYKGLVTEISNWPQFLFFKANNKSSFTFKLRNENTIKVPKNMLPPFKEIFFDQVYLKHIPQAILKKEKLSVIDIGANVGYFSIFMLYNFPGSRVYSFEPMPFNFNKIQHYKAENNLSGLTAYNKAVSGTNGTLSLNHAGNDAFSTMASVYESTGRNNKIEVEAVTLESIFHDHKLDRLDFMKLDCEGSEYAILYSAPETLLSSISAMSIETHAGPGGNENNASLAAFLKSKGFKVIAADEGKAGYIWAWQERLVPEQ